MEGCLRAIPTFIQRHKQDDPIREEMKVGALKLVLSWVMESEGDYLLDAVNQHRDHILNAYQQFADRKPIVLLDLQEQRIYVHPYEEFKSDMRPKSQKSLAEQYEKALRDNKIVVFVRDNEQRRLASFSIDKE